MPPPDTSHLTAGGDSRSKSDTEDSKSEVSKSQTSQLSSRTRLAHALQECSKSGASSQSERQANLGGSRSASSGLGEHAGESEGSRHSREANPISGRGASARSAQPFDPARRDPTEDPVVVASARSSRTSKLSAQLASSRQSARSSHDGPPLPPPDAQPPPGAGVSDFLSDRTSVEVNPTLDYVADSNRDGPSTVGNDSAEAVPVQREVEENGSECGGGKTVDADVTGAGAATDAESARSAANSGRNQTRGASSTKDDLSENSERGKSNEGKSDSSDRDRSNEVKIEGSADEPGVPTVSIVATSRSGISEDCACSDDGRTAIITPSSASGGGAAVWAASKNKEGIQDFFKRIGDNVARPPNQEGSQEYTDPTESSTDRSVEKRKGEARPLLDSESSGDEDEEIGESVDTPRRKSSLIEFVTQTPNGKVLAVLVVGMAMVPVAAAVLRWFGTSGLIQAVQMDAENVVASATGSKSTGQQTVQTTVSDVQIANPLTSTPPPTSVVPAAVTTTSILAWPTSATSSLARPILSPNGAAAEPTIIQTSTAVPNIPTVAVANAPIKPGSAQGLPTITQTSTATPKIQTVAVSKAPIRPWAASTAAPPQASTTQSSEVEPITGSWATTLEGPTSVPTKIQPSIVPPAKLVPTDPAGAQMPLAAGTNPVRYPPPIPSVPSAGIGERTTEAAKPVTGTIRSRAGSAPSTGLTTTASSTGIAAVPIGGYIPAASPDTSQYCAVGDWVQWSDCTAVCTTGHQYRRRVVLNNSSPSCTVPELLGKRTCLPTSSKGCAPEVFSDWGPWSSCSSTCGVGFRQRQRLRFSAPAGPFYQMPQAADVVEVDPCGAASACDESCNAAAVRKGLQVVKGLSMDASLELCQAPLASGASCKYSCERHLEAGARPAVCVRGVLVAPIQGCNTRRCTDPPLVYNGASELLRSCGGYGVGSKCPVLCRAGFQPTQPFVTCQSDGSWDIEGVECTEMTCRAAPRITDAFDVGDCSIPEDAPLGTPCSYFRCFAGFVQVGDLVCRNGNFNRPYCIPQSPGFSRRLLGRRRRHCLAELAPNVINAAVSRMELESLCGDMEDGESCEFSCAPGHRKMGDLLCMDGQWVAPTCTRPNCQLAPRIKHSFGLESCAGAENGGVCRVVCRAGYEPDSHWTQCVEGSWSRVSCIPLQCGDLPAVPNSEPMENDCQKSVGDRCLLKCRPGFRPSGVFECMLGGVFSLPQCEEKPCSGKGICAGAAAGAVCRRPCQHGQRGPNSVLSILSSKMFGGNFGGQHTPEPGIAATVCSAGKWVSIEGSCRDVAEQICRAPPRLPNQKKFKWGDQPPCTRIRAGDRCNNFECASGYEVTERPLCSASTFRFVGGVCMPKRCELPDTPRSPRVIRESCEKGVPVCPVRCRAPYRKKSDTACINGTYLRGNCTRNNKRKHVALARLDLPPPRTGIAEVPDSSPALQQEWRCRLATAAKIPVWRVRVLPITPGPEGRTMFGGITLLVAVLPAWVDSNVSPTADYVRAAATGFIDRMALQPKLDVRVAAGHLLQSMEEYTRQNILSAALHLTWSLAEEPTPTGWPPSAHESMERILDAYSLRLVDGGTVEVKKLGVSTGKTCNSVPTVSGAAFDSLQACRGMPSGLSCPVRCQSGREPRPAPPYCADGVWTPATCLGENFVSCQHPPPNVVHGAGHRCHDGPAHDLSSGDDITEKPLTAPICRVLCEPGWHAIGTILCEGGMWVPTVGKLDDICQENVCSDIPVVLNGANLARCQGFISGQSCPLSCAPGYLPNGNGEMKCRRGNWVYTSSSCQPASCELPPTIPHAVPQTRNCAGTGHAETCDLACAPGYEVHGGDLRCHHGQWLTGPKCEHSPCRDLPTGPGLPPPSELEHCAPTKYGEVCKIQCKTGERLSAPLVCAREGWSEQRCLPARKPPRRCPVQLSGPSSWCVAQGEDGDVCTMPACRTGFVPAGPAPVCANGVWYSPEGSRCDPAPCNDPPAGEHVSAQFVEACRGAFHGSKCVLFCDDGYAPDGQEVFVLDAAYAASILERSASTCDHGVWRGTKCKPAACNSPLPAFPDAAHLDRCIGTPSGQRCEKSVCAGGGWMIMESGPMCHHSVWDVSHVKCVEVDCQEAPGGHGLIDAVECAGMLSGRFCSLRCADALAEASPPELLCHRGAWLPAGVVPRCGRPCRGAELAITDAVSLQEDCGWLADGKTCAFRCVEGWAAGNALKCEDGRWQFGDLAFCYPEGDGRGHAYVEQSFLLSGWIPTLISLHSIARNFRDFICEVAGIPPVEASATLLQSMNETGATLTLRVFCDEIGGHKKNHNEFNGAISWYKPQLSCAEVLDLVSELVPRQHEEVEREFGKIICKEVCNGRAPTNSTRGAHCEERCRHALDLGIGHIPFTGSRIRHWPAEGTCGQFVG